MKKCLELLSVFTLVLCLAIVAVSFAQPPPRGIAAEDYYSFEFLSEPSIAPHGKLVAYVVTKVDRAQNRRNTSIWMAAVDGSRAPWQFTTSPQSSNAPLWSPDGQSLAFLSSRPSMDPPPETSVQGAPPSAVSLPSPAAAAGPTPAPAAGAASGAPPADQPRSQVYLLPRVAVKQSESQT